MSEWRYLATRLKGDGTEETLAVDLPLTGVQITKTLSGPDAISATITPEVARLKDEDGRAIFVPWSTAVYAEASGQIRAGCIVTPESTLQGPECSIDATGFYGYAAGMPYEKEWPIRNEDPVAVFRALWNDLQGYKGGDLGLIVDPRARSRVRIGVVGSEEEFVRGEDPGEKEKNDPYRLTWWETHDLGAEMEKLAEATPFDFRERHVWNGDVIRHHLDLGYPRLGKRLDMRLVEGENVTVVPQVSYADDYADEVVVLGAGEGRKMKRGTAHRKDERLRRTVIVTDKSLRSDAECRARAEREVKTMLGAPEVSEIVVRDHPSSQVGSISVGDEVFLQSGKTGWSAGLDLWCRVTQMTVSPAEGDAVTLSVVRST